MKLLLLLRKDLRVLGRSPALVAAFLAYPLVIAVLVGLVVRFAGDRPRVAFVDLDGLPEEVLIGGQSFDVDQVIEDARGGAELVWLSEQEAEHQLETGQVVATIVVPPGFTSKLRGMVESPTLVLKTTKGGLAPRVEQKTQALVYRLNRRLQEAYISANLAYIELLREGGTGRFLGEELEVLGLERASELLAEIEREVGDPGVEERIRRLSSFIDTARLALEQSDETLLATANPIALRSESEGGREWVLSAQVQSHALALTLAFVCILLAAAAIAAERDENVIGRLARGLVGLGELVAAKIALVAVVGAVLGLVLALAFGVTAELAGAAGGEPWLRLPLLFVALALAAAAFGAFGVLLGVLAREARTASLVAFLVTLPLVLAGLFPEATLASVRVLSEASPFVHAARLFESALYGLDPWATLAREAAWLAALGLVFAAAARVGMRRLLA